MEVAGLVLNILVLVGLVVAVLIDHILSSEEYRERRESTICAYPVVQKISEPFLGSAKDIEVANSIPIPDYGKAICFPYRFLGKPDVSAFPNQAGDKLSNELDSTASWILKWSPVAPLIPLCTRILEWWMGKENDKQP